MSSKHDFQADELPSYDEATLSPVNYSLPGTDIISEIDHQRRELVSSAIERHISPVLRRQARYGISGSTTLLEPYEPPAFSHEKSSTNNAKDQKHGEIVSPSDDDLVIAQLEGEENSLEFWSQPSVAQELKQQLLDILSTFSDFTDSSSRAREANPEPEAASSRIGWRKRAKKASESFRAVQMSPAQSSERVRVTIDREGIVLRTVNDFGLYETVTKPAVIVRINTQR